MSDQRGIAPGAGVWHAYARNMRRNFWALVRQCELVEAERDGLTTERDRLLVLTARLRDEVERLRDECDEWRERWWREC